MKTIQHVFRRRNCRRSLGINKKKNFLFFICLDIAANAGDANHSSVEQLGDSIQKPWLQLRFHSQEPFKIRKPHELESEMKNPPSPSKSLRIFDQIHGSLMGLAIGDALGAPVEFRPRQFLLENQVTDFQKGGTWNLKEGQVSQIRHLKILQLSISIICNA